MGAPASSDQVTAAAAIYDEQMEVLRRGLSAILLVTAWADILLGILMVTSWASDTMAIPALSTHFAYIPSPVWAVAITALGVLQLHHRTRIPALAGAAAWHTAWAFGFVLVALNNVDNAPHYAIAIYLSTAFTRAVKAGVVHLLRHSHRGFAS